ncbi:MAG TPA: ATP-binding protein [Steroidobacteraceae bacterium]|nr:ATP-binding protein [Steroidobacteraceae bacterium]
MSRPSLSRRLLLSVFIVLVAFFGLTVFLLDRVFQRAAERSLRELIDAQMVALIAAADPDGPESVTPTAVLETRFDTPGSGLYAEIRSASGESIWRSQSTVGTEVQFGPPLEGGERSFFYTEIAGTKIRLAVASRGIVWDDLHGQPARFTFSVATSLEGYEAQLASLRQQMVGWFVGMAVLLVATLALLLRWLLKPVRRLELEIKEVEAGTREHLGDAWPRELSAVTSNLNALLYGERTRIRRYRDTLGNLAHSLKTPLAVMRQSLGAGGANKDALNAEIDRMSGIIEHQMKRAAASGGVLLGQAPVDVAPIVSELRVALLKVYGSKDLLFETPVQPDAQFIGDRADLTELLGNLLDNGCKWARARVRIEVWIDGKADSRAALRLVVDDDGPGIAEADRAKVLQRGGRADEATPGYGLGLSMVHDTVALYGGTMRIDSSSFGGARFELALPGRHGGQPLFPSKRGQSSAGADRIEG